MARSDVKHLRVAPILRVQIETRRLGHFHDLGIHVEAGGAAEGDFLVAAAELEAAAFREGLHVGACGEAADSAILSPHDIHRRPPL